jgi:hypothetical protein
MASDNRDGWDMVHVVHLQVKSQSRWEEGVGQGLQKMVIPKALPL